MMKQIVLLISFSMVSVLTWAKTPSDESLNELMQVVQAEKMSQKMIQQFQTSFSSVFDAMKIDDKLTPEQEKELNGIMSEFMQDIMSDMASQQSISEMMSYYLAAAKQTYTQSEVDAMIAFYGSEEGRSIIEKQPVVMQKYMHNIQPYFAKKMQLMQQEALPELQRKMESFSRKHKLK